MKIQGTPLRVVRACEWEDRRCGKTAVALCGWVEPVDGPSPRPEPYREWLCVEHLADVSRLFHAELIELANPHQKGEPMPNAPALTNEQIELLRSLPKWNGPSVTGHLASPESDELERLGLAIGSRHDEPFNGPDGENPRVWRTLAGDLLIATIDSQQAVSRGSDGAEIQRLSELVRAAASWPHGIDLEGVADDLARLSKDSTPSATPLRQGRFAADPESKVVKAELVEPDPRSTTQFYPYWQVTARVEVPHKGDYAVTVSPANPQNQEDGETDA